MAGSVGAVARATLHARAARTVWFTRPMRPDATATAHTVVLWTTTHAKGATRARATWSYWPTWAARTIHARVEVATLKSLIHIWPHLTTATAHHWPWTIKRALVEWHARSSLLPQRAGWPSPTAATHLSTAPHAHHLTSSSSR